MIEDPISSTSGHPDTLNFNITADFSNHQEMPSKGYCRLFKAQRHGKWYVLKGLQPQYNANPLYMAMLEKEFETAVKMDHPSIVHTYGIENDPVAGSCIAMEYVDGRTLSVFLDEKPSLSLRKKIVFQLLDAMRYYHSLQIIHRDLKPSNIIITRNGDNVKLIDFGLADADDYAILKEPAYTEGYAAPEQKVNGATIDCRTDLYAFGILLRQIFPHRYRHIAQRCTKADPGDRYRDAAQVIQALHRSKPWLVALPLIAFAAIAVSIASYYIKQEEHLQEILGNGLTVEQATLLLQNYSDSLLNDYKERLARNEYDNYFTATQNGPINLFLTIRYKYYLLAHLPQYEDVEEKENVFNALSNSFSKTQEQYDLIKDTLSLPDCNPFDFIAQTYSVTTEVELLTTEINMLDKFYNEGHLDSIIYYTQQYYSPI